MKQVQELLHKQMTRKEFMKLFCMALLAVFGVNNLVMLLANRAGVVQADRRVSQQPSSPQAFGTRKFGA